MGEMKDYSGPYVPSLKYEDLSKDVLVKLLRAYSRECNVLPTYWAEEMRKRLGEEAEKECLLSTWKRIGKYETKWAMEAANIKGNDVETYVKVTQLMGSFAQGYYKYNFDLKGKNHAVLTVYYCPAFNALEKAGDLDRLNWVCNVMEEEVMKEYIKVVNPAIRVTCLRAGPRKSQDEVHCQWEFKLGE
jgi:hypothetical protein